MCDMQKLPTREDASCEDETDMNFATFSAVGSAGTHFVTTGGQLAMPKLQQNVANNANLQQVCLAMGDGGVQYVRTLEGGATLQTTPQLISVPISLPGTKPGDPQPTVQIQVLSPNHLIQAQQPPKYQMQLQGFQQGGTVLTVAYSPETNDASNIRLVGQGGMGEGLQVLTTLPQEMQLVQQAHTQEKEQIPNNMHQVFITPNHQIIINTPDGKILNNNTTSDNNNTGEEDIIIKEECDENNDDESSQGTEADDTIQWRIGTNNQEDLVKYLNSLPQQQTQELPASLQQFLRMNPTDLKKEVTVAMVDKDMPQEVKKPSEANSAEDVLWEDTRTQSKKKKKYKKKPPKPVRPKPGQIVIAAAMDGTPMYCCPECNMAYQEKELLEAHLVQHNIERRFICGLCGAGLKRKEHLERHKLGHNPERPYVCSVCRKGFKRREHLNLHTVIHSGVKTEMCNVCGKGFYRKDHLRKHTRSHESKRARDEANNDGTSSTQVHNNSSVVLPAVAAAAGQTGQTGQIMPEITIHIPTSISNQAPVQINIPSHVVSSLATHAEPHTLDALLANHS